MANEELKKKLYVGEDTKNTAEVTEERRNAHSLEGEYSKVLMRQAGKLHAPQGAKYLGSATVHYFSKDGLSLNQKNYFVVCQADVKDVTEGHCDVGWKQLKSALMQAFGRQEPRTRQN